MVKKRFSLDPATGRLSESDSKRYFSTVGFAIFAQMAVSYGGALVMSVILSMWAPWLLEYEAVSIGVSMFCQYGLGLPICLAILKRLPKDVNPPEKMGFGSFVGGLCAAFTLMSVGSFISNHIIALAELLTNRQLVNPIESSAVGTHWLVNLIFVAIAAPILEEIFFRKILCDRLLPLGEGYAVVLSAVIFGLAHGNFFQFFYAFLLGLLFSTVYVKTGRLSYTIIYHSLINLMGGVIAPILVEKLTPIMNEESLERMQTVMESDSVEEMEALTQWLAPYLPYVYGYFAYTVFYFVASVSGAFIIMKNIRRIKLRSGLLPPSEEGRVTNILLNGGVAAAITIFVGIFILSLL